MLLPSVCIDLVFAGVNLVSSVEAVAGAGIPAVEIWGWRNKNLDVLADALHRTGLVMSNMSMDPAVYLMDGDGVDALEESVKASIQAAKTLDCKRMVLHVQAVPCGAGEPWFVFMEDISRWKQRRANIIAALRRVVPIAENAGITLLLEPLNTTVDHAGYFIACTSHAADIVREVGSPALRLLFDIYHMQISEGNLTKNLLDNRDTIDYIHIADVPGRHEPGTGEINYPNVLLSAARAGYDGFVGLEYVPTFDSVEQVAAMINRVNEIAANNPDEAVWISPLP